MLRKFILSIMTLVKKSKKIQKYLMSLLLALIGF